MRQGTYTLPESEMVAISRLEPLSPDRRNHSHNFRSTNFEEAELDGLNLSLLKDQWRRSFITHAPEYILFFHDGTPLAWFTRQGDRNSWYIPALRIGLPSSLYRIITFIEGLRLGMACAAEVT